MPEPILSAVVVHWRNEEEIVRLLEAWFEQDIEGWDVEVLIVDNSSSLDPAGLRRFPQVRHLDPGRNLGFAGGVNYGTAASRAPWILILNPDLRPQAGAIDRLLEALTNTEAAGIVPALVEEDGTSQCAWQLRPLPTPWALLLQTFFFAGVHGPSEEPPAGTVIEQPAAAALALRRAVLEEVGGLDEGFQPAWFEDVDLAYRLRERGHQMVFEPASRWVHLQGGSVPSLGYGRFLKIYYRNLLVYLEKHHVGWTPIVRCTLTLGMLLRILALPLRCPRRAVDRRDAARGLWGVVVSTWSRPV